ncbi:MAG: alpha/beta hydrolase [Fibrobacter sp.]|nr:alpha/beta hydrolase [Fibrobacter sp.]
MDQKKSQFAPKIKEFCLRALRLVGVFVLIYVCMVFYLALTERQKAFPRAITHKEANEAIQGKAKKLTCTLEDGIILGGWSIGKENAPVLLYYPDAEEDAAQFLAEIEEIPGIQLVSFNYRGSGENKGKPSEENFENDGKQIFECAAQVNGATPSYVMGHGTGSILAAQQVSNKKYAQTIQLIFSDPIFSIADAVSQKYRKLYPKFLVRTDVSVQQNVLDNVKKTPIVILDRKQFEHRTLNNIRIIKNKTIVNRNGETLSSTLQKSLEFSAIKED